MLISETYRELNKQLHVSRPDYGVSSSKWTDTVLDMAQSYGARSILDYGCGKGRLKEGIGHTITVNEYDPAIPGKDINPMPADIVVCTDVMEHIEPDLLDNVLDHIQRLANKAVFLTVATRPAKKTLPDGRNAHLIQKSLEWWLPKLWERFTIRAFNDYGGEFLAILEPK